MQNGQITSNVLIGGIGFTSTVNRSAEGQISHVIDLPAGIAGAISSAGADGLPTGHGLVQSDTVDIHWTNGVLHKCRQGVTLDTAAANAVTFDNSPAATGDALPEVGTAVIISKRVPVLTGWVAPDMEMIAMRCSQRAIVDFIVEGTPVVTVKLVAGEAWSWVSGHNIANPLGVYPISSLAVSNGSTNPATLSVGVLYQSVE